MLGHETVASRSAGLGVEVEGVTGHRASEASKACWVKPSAASIAPEASTSRRTESKASRSPCGSRDGEGEESPREVGTRRDRPRRGGAGSKGGQGRQGPRREDGGDHDIEHWGEVALLLGHDGAATGVDVLVGVAFLGRVARKHDLVARGVTSISVIEAPDDGELVHHLGALGEKIANVDARHVGAGGTEVAAVFLRGVGLGIPSLVLGGAAALPENDDGFVSGGLGGACESFGLEKSERVRRHAQSRP